jgi:choline dehydrogenase-like flavoprotein
MPSVGRVVVIGSGPAGVACAAALVARGVRPLVVDGGADLDGRPARTAAALAAVEPAAWPQQLVRELRGSFSVDADRLPLKPLFGSLFPYAADAIRAEGVEGVPSHAQGGLSTVWGGAMLPYSAREHDGWPFGPEELAPHYRAVLKFVPLAGEADALEAEFPLHVDKPLSLRTTAQVESLLRDLRRSGTRLRAAGVLAGRSRLAVRAEACRYVGLCMLGCPYGAIWNATETLRRLVSDGVAEHRPGLLVRSWEERRDGVHIDVAVSGGGKEELLAERLFVAAGALSTTRLLLASTASYDEPLTLADSTYFTFPALRWSGAPVRLGAAGNTLAHAFVEIDDSRVSAHRVHIQLYGFNDLMVSALAARLRLPEPLAGRLFGPLLGRLLYAQCYLHSKESPSITAALSRDGVLVLERGAGDARDGVARVLQKLRSLRRELRLEPLSPMLRIWPSGKGFHTGSSVPMSAAPGPAESDLLGRPHGSERVHIVDASVVPTVPAPTITLPVMANAHRIGTLAAEL